MTHSPMRDEPLVWPFLRRPAPCPGVPAATGVRQRAVRAIVLIYARGWLNNFHNAVYFSDHIVGTPVGSRSRAVNNILVTIVHANRVDIRSDCAVITFDHILQG